ncbi:MAG: pilus assembly protein [Dehalococcoidia bacterium]|nr:pilus assembly protein [Dehalococcoidia bacterium]
MRSYRLSWLKNTVKRGRAEPAKASSPSFRTGRLWSASGGQSLVEFALVLPLLLLVIMGVFDIGIGVWQYNTVSNVTREAVRYAAARANQPLTPADFTDNAANPRSNAAAVAAGRRQAFGLQPANLDLRVLPDDDWEQRNTWGLVVRATAVYTFSPITAFVPKGLIMIRSSSSMVTE